MIETLSKLSSSKLFSRPLKTLPKTSNSLLLERSRIARFGNVANAASSSLTNRFEDKSSFVNRCRDKSIETVPSVQKACISELTYSEFI